MSLETAIEMVLLPKHILNVQALFKPTCTSISVYDSSVPG